MEGTLHEDVLGLPYPEITSQSTCALAGKRMNATFLDRIINLVSTLLSPHNRTKLELPKTRAKYLGTKHSSQERLQVSHTSQYLDRQSMR